MVDHNDRNVRYDYDSVGNQTIVATELSETHYTYDSLKRQIEVIAKGAPNSKQQESITKILYNGYDLEQKIYPNDLVMHHQYDLMGRLTQVEQTDVDFKEFIRLVERHHYDPQGNATLEYKVDWFDNTLSENVKYQYDTLNRLTTATETRGKFNRDYTYDTLGNLVEETDKSYYNDSITVYSIDELNRLTGKETTNILQDKTHEKAMFTYEFDKRGNMVAEINELSGSRQGYTYDLTNRMIEGISHEKRTSSYQFNGLGCLVSHGQNTDTKDYLLDYTQQVPQELLEIQERRSIAYSYLGRDKLTALTATSLEQVALNYHHDMLGSVRYATDQQGQVQLSNIYSEWGVPRVTQRNKGEVSQPSYTGHMFDDVLEVYYAKARVYDQGNRHFGAEDLVKGFFDDTLTLNSYLYTLSNPLVFIDPDGLVGIPIRPRPLPLPIIPPYIPSQHHPLDIMTSAAPRVRDVTDEVNTALERTVIEAREIRSRRPGAHPFVSASITHALQGMHRQETLGWFIGQVNHNHPWDIKVPGRCYDTIGTAFPGTINTPVGFRDTLMTPESLGNWTYGYIGAALGLSLLELIGGSWYADGFSMPWTDNFLNNELLDWGYVRRGFEAYRSGESPWNLAGCFGN